MSIRRFKIHAVNTASTADKADNGKFYGSFEEALEMARSYVRASGKQMVIYEAAYLVKPVELPIIVEALK